MFTPKKYVLSLTLTLCSLGLMAGEADLKEKTAKTPAGYFARARSLFSRQSKKKEIVSPEKMAKVPKDLQRLIVQFAEKDEYVPVKTFNTPGPLLAFHDDGKKLTSVAGFGRYDNDVFVITRNIEDRRIIAQFTKEIVGNHHDLSLSGNGKVVADQHNILDTTTRDMIASIPSEFSRTRLNYDGTMFFANESPMVLFDIHKKKKIPLLGVEPALLGGNEYSVPAPTPIFSHDGKTFACVSLRNDFISLFDTETGLEKQRIDTNVLLANIPFDPPGVTSLALHKNKPYLAYSAVNFPESEAVLVNLLTGEKKKITAEKQSVLSRLNPLGSEIPLICRVGFTNTGDTIYTVSRIDSEQRQLKLSMHFWDMESLQNSTAIQPIQLDIDGYTPEVVSSITFGPDDKFLAIGSDTETQLLRRSNPLQDQIEKTKKAKAFREKKEKEAQENKRLELIAKNPGYTARAAAIEQKRLPAIPTGRPKQKPVKPVDIDSEIFASQALRYRPSSPVNVFYQSAMKQALQKKQEQKATIKTPIVQSINMNEPD